MKRIAPALLALLAAALVADAAGANPAPAAVMTVLRVTGDRVDVAIEGTRTPGPGVRLVVERGGEVIAELEVVRASSGSVSCRIEREVAEIAIGDRVQPAERAVALQPAAPAPEPPVPSPSEPPPVADLGPGLHVRQVMGTSVFLDAGRAAGLVPGQRIEVVRAGATIAILEVEFVSERSASCRLVESTEPVQNGDGAVAGPAPATPPATAVAEATTSSSGATSVSPAPRPARSPRTPKKPSWVDASGSVALRWQGFKDGGDTGRDLVQTLALVNLNLRRIGGSPYEVRIRLRQGQDQISNPLGSDETRPQDRLYEMSVVYAPEQGRFGYQLGRLTAGPEVGFDYLDGLLGEYHATPRFSVGGFYGNRSDVEEIAYDSGGQAYGAFVRHLVQSPDQPFYSEILAGAIGEYRGGQVNREYVSIYGRQGSGSRWSLYERAELDLNRDWRATDQGTDYQLSNLLFSGNYTVSKAVRLSLTYDELRRFRTLDDRDTPEEIFDDALREGYRLSAYLGSGRGLRSNLSVGLRRRAGDPEQNLTWNASVYHGDLLGWNLLAGADYSAFSGDTSEGWRAGLRFQKYFDRGHDVEITVGRSMTTLITLDEIREAEWLRLSGTLQFGRRFFLLGEYEITRGDDLAGQRLFLQLGYRL
jgi:hypothetical protein